RRVLAPSDTAACASFSRASRGSSWTRLVGVAGSAARTSSRVTRLLAPVSLAASLPWPPLPFDAFALFMLLASSFQAAVDRLLRGRAPAPAGVSEARTRGVPEGARRAASDRPPASLVIPATVVGPVMG